MTETGETTGRAPVSSGAKGSKKARNGAARLAAAQTVFQMLTTGRSARAAAEDFLEHSAGMPVETEILLEPDRALYVAIVQGVEARRDVLDEILRSSLKIGEDADDKKEKSIDVLMRSILLCGCFEILAHNEIDAPVIISDWLHVTRAFYEGRETGLVNAVLDGLAKTVRGGASVQEVLAAPEELDPAGAAQENVAQEE